MDWETSKVVRGTKVLEDVVAAAAAAAAAEAAALRGAPIAEERVLSRIN
jgi:hypothetical protein